MHASISAGRSAKKSSKPAPRAKLEKLIGHVSARDWTKAQALAGELLKKHPTDVNALTLGSRVALNGRRNAQLALKRAEAALKIAPTAAEAHRGALMALTALGDKEGVADAAERWISADPLRAGGYYELARVDAERASKHQPLMGKLLKSDGLDRVSRALLANAVGLISEKSGRLEEAFRAFLDSKSALDRAYDPAPFQRYFDACERIFTPERLAETADCDGEDRRHVFVLGLPRTGSTLVERVLCAHPDVEALGEARALDNVLNEAGAALGGEGCPQARIDRFLGRGAPALREVARGYAKAVAPLLARPAAARWVDKMPGNFLYCGAIAVLFPKARIIMTDRDPRDAMLSCLRTFFSAGQSFTSDFEAFLAHWRLQRQFAELWRERLGERLADARYEDMIAEPEAQARRLVSHIGVDWDARCAAPEAQEGVVQTASAFQVREKIHSRSIGGWKRYEAQFEPFNEALARSGAARSQHC